MDFFETETFRVRFSETDMAGIVHFSQILRWAENAEGAFFREHDIPFVEKNGNLLSGWPRVRVQADFLAPARYDDCIRVRIRPQNIPADDACALSWEFEVVRVSDNSENAIARGEWTSVYAEADTSTGKLRSCRQIPAALKKILKNFQKRLTDD